MPVCRLNSKYEVQQWLKRLYKAGYKTYYHSDLPKKLQNSSFHRSAFRQGLITMTGNSRSNGTSVKHEWTISEHVLDKCTSAFAVHMKRS